MWACHLSAQSTRNRPQDQPVPVTKDEPHHYTRITDLNSLLNKQSKDTPRLYFCERCLHGFTRGDLLEEHKPDCRGINQAAVAIKIPKPGTDQSKICFENHHKQLKALYTDFEILSPKINGPALDPPQKKKSGTRQKPFTKPVPTATLWAEPKDKPSRHSSTVGQMQPNTS